MSTASTPKLLHTRLGPVEYVELGEGPVVLALHGAMGGYDQSLLIARTIGAQGYRYIAVSRPGYLGTPLSAGESPEAQADLCAALLEALGVGQAAVMAVSGGGPCAMHFALRHAERCWSLVLVSTCGEIIDTPLPLSFHIMTFLARWPPIVNAMRKRAARNPERAASRSISDPAVRARTLADPEVGPLFKALLASTSDRVEQRLAGTQNDIAITRGTTYPLEAIRVPTLVVHGTQDPLVPFERHAKALVSRIPGAELVRVDEGEHVAIFTHNQEVRERVARFLRAHAPVTSRLLGEPGSN